MAQQNEDTIIETNPDAEEIFSKKSSGGFFSKRNLIIFLTPFAIILAIWVILLISMGASSSSRGADNFEFELTSKENRIYNDTYEKFVRVGIDIKNDTKYDANKLKALLTFYNNEGEQIYEASGTFDINAEAGKTSNLLVDLTSSSKEKMDTFRSLELSELRMEISEVVVQYTDGETSINGPRAFVTPILILSLTVIVVWVVMSLLCMCPNCKSIFTIRVIDKEELDRHSAKWEEKKATDISQTVTVCGDVVSYRVTKKCKCCGKTFTQSTTEKQKY